MRIKSADFAGFLNRAPEISANAPAAAQIASISRPMGHILLE
jgi:hypothetical protein